MKIFLSLLIVCAGLMVAEEGKCSSCGKGKGNKIMS